MYLVTKFYSGILRGSFRRRPFSSSAGFTLAEIVAVLAVTGILLTMAAPLFNRAVEDINLRHMANQLTRDIRYVQQRTMYEPAGGWKILFSQDTGSWTVNRNSMVQDRRSLPAGISFLGTPSGGNSIIFNENGTTDSTVIGLTTSRGRVLHVNILGETGRMWID